MSKKDRAYFTSLIKYSQPVVDWGKKAVTVDLPG